LTIASEPERELPRVWWRVDLGGSFVAAPGSPTYVGYGINLLGARVEFAHFALLVAPRFSNSAAPARTGRSMIRFAGSSGGRYLFVAGATSPFVGAGLTYGLASIDDTPGVAGDARGYGPGAYAEAGFELFRSTWYQLSAGLRADVPFYRAHSTSARGDVVVQRSHLVVPVSVDLTISVPWPRGLFL
jgi:hypothetical protein